MGLKTLLNAVAQRRKRVEGLSNPRTDSTARGLANKELFPLTEGAQHSCCADEQFTRNRIRARLMPALRAAFPQFLDTFARSASHAAQGQQVLNEVAAQDLDAVCHGADSLPRIKVLQVLSRARQANALRYWLKSSQQVIPSAAQLSELLVQMADCTTRGHRIYIKVGQGFVKRSGDVLAWYNP